MKLADQEHNELLMELTTSQYWKALKKELSNTLQTYQGQLLAPASNEFDLIRKEATSARYDALNRFFVEIERQVDRYAKGKSE